MQALFVFLLALIAAVAYMLATMSPELPQPATPGVLRGVAANMSHWEHLIELYEPPKHPVTVRPLGKTVVAVMALWEEAYVLPLAIDSTRHVVSEYVVVHKQGNDDTLKVLHQCIDRWGVRVQYYQSSMTLRQAREFAMHVSNSYADIFVVQDGDEVFYSNGPSNILNAIRLIAQDATDALLSKMVYLKHDLMHTLKDSYQPGKPGKWGGHPANGIMLIPHVTLFRNAPGLTIMPNDLREDVPAIRSGRSLTMHDPWKFDVSIKNPVRELLRQSFLEWSHAGSPGTIEEFALTHSYYHLQYVKEGRSTSLQESAVLYMKEVVVAFLQVYDPEEWFPYPAAIQKYVDAGFIRAFEGVFPAD